MAVWATMRADPEHTGQRPHRLAGLLERLDLRELAERDLEARRVDRDRLDDLRVVLGILYYSLRFYVAEGPVVIPGVARGTATPVSPADWAGACRTPCKRRDGSFSR